MPSNETLLECLKNLIEKIISITSPSLDKYIPPYLGTKYEKYFSNYEGHLMNPHLYTDKPISQKLYEEFLSEKKNQVEELEEFKKCINTINTSDVVLKNRKKFTEIWGNQFDINYDYFFSLIWKVVKSSYEKDSFDESKFIKEYEKLKDFFHNENTAQVQILVPLHNLESNFGNIDVSDLIESTGRLVLRPITDEDKTFLISVIGGYESERTISIHSSDFMLELEYYDKFYSEGEYFHEKIKAQVAELITALRLLKKGYVGASLILVRHPILDKTINVIHLDYDLFSILPVKVNQGKISYNRPYILKKDEIGELQTILHLLKEITDKNKGLAIRRFNSAYEKSNKADKFLDLMIACEALLRHE